LIKENKKEN